MPTLRIDDLVITTREVEVPEKCPKCGVSFVEQDSSNLREANYGDMYFDGYITQNAEDRDYHENDGHYPASGETFLVVGYDCSNCQHPIAHGSEERKTT